MIEEIVVEWGIIAIFIMMLCNGCISAFPSEWVISTAGAMTVGHNEYIIVFFGVIVLANYIGTSLLFLLSSCKGRVWYDKIRAMRIVRNISFFNKMLPTSEELLAFWEGKEWLVFACRFLPFIRSMISIPAGIAKMDYIKYSVYSILGIIIWTTGWMLVGRFMMENYLSGKYLIFLVFFLLFGIVYLIGKRIQKKIIK